MDAGKGHAVATIRLALTVGAYAEKLVAIGACSNQRIAEKRVRNQVHELLGKKDKPLVSRLFGIVKMTEAFARENLSLTGVRSQGVLYAMLSVWKTARDSNRLRELVDDAADLSIKDFRHKWSPSNGKHKQRPPARASVEVVLDWVERSAGDDDLLRVWEAIEARLDGESCEGHN